MRRSLLVCMALCLAISASASAQSANAQMRDFKGQSWATGHLGYSVGMGDAFSSYTEPITNTELSSDAGVGFGGQFYYGLKDNLLIGGELMFQSYTVSLSTPANLSLSIPATEVSATQTKTNLIVNTLYAVNQTRNSSLFLINGIGLYDFGGTNLGLNTGIVWRKQVSDNVHLFGMPRLHVILADTTPTMFQFTMGAQFGI